MTSGPLSAGAERLVGHLEAHLGVKHAWSVDRVAEHDGDWDRLVKAHADDHEFGHSHLHPDLPRSIFHARNPDESDPRVHEVGAVLARHRAITNHPQLRCPCGWQGRDLTPESPYYDWTAYHEHVARDVLAKAREDTP